MSEDVATNLVTLNAIISISISTSASTSTASSFMPIVVVVVVAISIDVAILVGSRRRVCRCRQHPYSPYRL